MFALSHKYELVQLNDTCERFMASIIGTFSLKYFVFSIYFITDAKNILHYCRIIDIYGAPLLKNVSFIFSRHNSPVPRQCSLIICNTYCDTFLFVILHIYKL